jgi:hypothetical protein
MGSKEEPCGALKCSKPAAYKIAAPWCVGHPEELTTSALAHREAEVRKVAFPSSLNVRLGDVGIDRCQPDRPALRLYGLEATCRSWDEAERKNRQFEKRLERLSGLASVGRRALSWRFTAILEPAHRSPPALSSVHRPEGRMGATWKTSPRPRSSRFFSAAVDV